MPVGLQKPIKEFSEEELLEKLERADMNSPVSSFVMGELTRRAIVSLNQNIKKFSEDSDKYSRILIAFGFVQLIVAMSAFTMAIIASADIWFSTILFVSTIMISMFAINKFLKIKK